MEEKERYEYFFGTNTIKDNKTNQFYGCVVDLLNQQDKQIKELEEENLSLQEQSIRDNQNWIEETTQLKQQLHDLPKKIVEEIRDVAGDYWEECGNVPDLNTLTMEDFDEILDTILEKYGGGDESNND